LPGDAYEAVLDRKGNLYAMCTAVKKDAMFPRDRRGVGNLFVIPMADVLANRRGEAKRKPSAEIPLRGLAATMILSPDGEWVYLLDTHNQKIVRVSTARQKVDGELDKLEPSTQSMCLTPDGKSLYALAVNGALQKFDAAAWKLEKIFQVRGGHSDIQAADDGRVFLNSSEGQWTNVQIFEVTKEAPPRPWAGIYHSNCIRLSPDQRRLYVSCWHLSPSNITSYYVPPEKSEAKAQQCGSCGLDANFGARGNVVVSPDGSFLFCDAGKIILLGR
jgi:sugar lactone lactonase YvrE